MSDTCNAARATKRRLATIVEAAAKDSIGTERWEGMSATEQTAAAHVYTGDCAQHVRNIILAAMSAAGASHLKADLEESLSTFLSFERMSTEVISLIRAVYKEMHHQGDYAKGKGRREFIPWLVEHHGTALYFPIERADGGRQDLDFDGALPIYLNRKYFVGFLKTLVFQLVHSNVLEDFLWTVLRCEEMIAFTRACTLIDLLVSRPLRWLAGKATALTNWSPFKMGLVYDQLEHAMEAAANDGSFLLRPELCAFS